MIQFKEHALAVSAMTATGWTGSSIPRVTVHTMTEGQRAVDTGQAHEDGFRQQYRIRIPSWPAGLLRDCWVCWGVGWLGWVGLGWVGLGWAGLGWVGMGWVGLGLGWGKLNWDGLGWVELWSSWVGLGLSGMGCGGMK